MTKPSARSVKKDSDTVVQKLPKPAGGLLGVTARRVVVNQPHTPATARPPSVPVEKKPSNAVHPARKVESSAGGSAKSRSRTASRSSRKCDDEDPEWEPPATRSQLKQHQYGGGSTPAPPKTPSLRRIDDGAPRRPSGGSTPAPPKTPSLRRMDDGAQKRPSGGSTPAPPKTPSLRRMDDGAQKRPSGGSTPAPPKTPSLKRMDDGAQKRPSGGSTPAPPRTPSLKRIDDGVQGRPGAGGSTPAFPKTPSLRRMDDGARKRPSGGSTPAPPKTPSLKRMDDEQGRPTAGGSTPAPPKTPSLRRKDDGQMRASRAEQEKTAGEKPTLFPSKDLITSRSSHKRAVEVDLKNTTAAGGFSVAAGKLLTEDCSTPAAAAAANMQARKMLPSGVSVRRVLEAQSQGAFEDAGNVAAVAKPPVDKPRGPSTEASSLVLTARFNDAFRKKRKPSSVASVGSSTSQSGETTPGPANKNEQTTTKPHQVKDQATKIQPAFKKMADTAFKTMHEGAARKEQPAGAVQDVPKKSSAASVTNEPAFAADIPSRKPVRQESTVVAPSSRTKAAGSSQQSTSSANAGGSGLKTSHPSVLLLASYGKPLPEAVRMKPIPKKSAAVEKPVEEKAGDFSNQKEQPKLPTVQAVEIVRARNAPAAGDTSVPSPAAVELKKPSGATSGNGPSSVAHSINEDNPSVASNKRRSSQSSRRRSRSQSKKPKIELTNVERPTAGGSDGIPQKELATPTPSAPVDEKGAPESKGSSDNTSVPKSPGRKKSSSSRKNKRPDEEPKKAPEQPSLRVSEPALPSEARQRTTGAVNQPESTPALPAVEDKPRATTSDEASSNFPPSVSSKEEIKTDSTTAADIPAHGTAYVTPAKPAGKDGGLAAKIAAARQAAEARKSGAAGKKATITYGVLNDEGLGKDLLGSLPTSQSESEGDGKQRPAAAVDFIADLSGSVARTGSKKEDTNELYETPRKDPREDGEPGEPSSKAISNKKNAPRKRPPPASKKAMPGVDEDSDSAPAPSVPAPKKPASGPSALRKMVARMVAPAAPVLRNVKPPTGRSLGPAFGSFSSSSSGKPGVSLPKSTLKAVELDISSIGPMGPKGTSIMDPAAKAPTAKAPPRGRSGAAGIKLLELDGLPPMPPNLMSQMNTKATGSTASRGKQKKKQQKSLSPDVLQSPQPTPPTEDLCDDSDQLVVITDYDQDMVDDAGLLEDMNPDNAGRSCPGKHTGHFSSASSSCSLSEVAGGSSTAFVPNDGMADHLKSKVIMERMVEKANGLPNVDSVIMPDRDAITDDVLWDFLAQRCPAGFGKKQDKPLFEPMTKTKPQKLKEISLDKTPPCGIIASVFLLSVDEGKAKYLCRWQLKKPDEYGENCIYQYVDRWQLKVYCPALLDAYEKANFGCDPDKLPKDMEKCVIVVGCNPADLRHCRSRTMDTAPRDHLKELQELQAAPKTPLIDSLPEDVVDGFSENLLFEEELVDVGLSGDEESPTVNEFDADGFRKPSAPDKNKPQKRKLLEDFELGYIQQPGSSDESDLWMKRRQGVDTYDYQGGFYEADYEEFDDYDENEWESWQQDLLPPSAGKPRHVPAGIAQPGKQPASAKVLPIKGHARAVPGIPSLLSQLSPPARSKEQQQSRERERQLVQRAGISAGLTHQSAADGPSVPSVPLGHPLPPLGHPLYQSEEYVSQMSRLYEDELARLKIEMDKMKAAGVSFPAMHPHQASVLAGMPLVSNNMTNRFGASAMAGNPLFQPMLPGVPGAAFLQQPGLLGNPPPGLHALLPMPPPVPQHPAAAYDRSTLLANDSFSRRVPNMDGGDANNGDGGGGERSDATHVS